MKVSAAHWLVSAKPATLKQQTKKKKGKIKIKFINLIENR